ncbi:MAG: helix-turn-helix domain-containing protein [Candidatus Marinimicrobia bacterium]|nr:helix-turn-helix domain-containing protein [Candidatus Neomarinimicrobiota bacterium]MCF7840080.1 helix-turn-helix domain-containing protein [Candidatus Neomarinimicrobiota bacterium]MCF7903318.1 helix-turn-helix domain-containing protein [Candidatus Neomarinimicrobiota bacterium]
MDTDSRRMNDPEFLTLDEAAKIVRTSARTIRRAIQRGRCKATRVSNRYLIHRKWLYAYALYGKTRLTSAEKDEIEYLMKDCWRGEK